MSRKRIPRDRRNAFDSIVILVGAYSWSIIIEFLGDRMPSRLGVLRVFGRVASSDVGQAYL
jgi:hypothetical protein